MNSARGTIVSAVLGVLAAAPIAALLLSGHAPGELLDASVRGFFAEVESVGFVLVPQLVLAVGILGLALQQGLRRAVGLPRLLPPEWLSPAVESALLLGLLGTISGMVAGFAGVSPDELEPAPLVRGLGAALRSTFVGFAIALVGVWLKDDGPDLATLQLAGAAIATGGDASGASISDSSISDLVSVSDLDSISDLGEGSPVPPHHPPLVSRPGSRP